MSTTKPASQLHEQPELPENAFSPEFRARVNALNYHVAHHQALERLGAKEAARGAALVWFEHALEFAAAPAVTIQEANVKCEYLQASVEAWAWLMLEEGRDGWSAGMLLAGAIAEAKRWALNSADGPAH